jgi:hypothetical protein
MASPVVAMLMYWIAVCLVAAVKIPPNRAIALLVGVAWTADAALEQADK